MQKFQSPLPGYRCTDRCESPEASNLASLAHAFISRLWCSPAANVASMSDSVNRQRLRDDVGNTFRSTRRTGYIDDPRAVQNGTEIFKSSFHATITVEGNDQVRH